MSGTTLPPASGPRVPTPRASSTTATEVGVHRQAVGVADGQGASGDRRTAAPAPVTARHPADPAAETALTLRRVGRP